MATSEDNLQQQAGLETEAYQATVAEQGQEHEQTTEVSHESTLFAEPVFNIGNFTVTNSLLNSWLAVLIIVVASLSLSSKVKRVPGRLQSLVELMIDGALNLMDSVTGDRKVSSKIFPLIFSIFIFILINNWLGILPGIGSIGFIESGQGHNIFVPLFRGGTADINTTLSLALFAVIAANVFGIMTVGAWKYFNKFVNLKTLAATPKEALKNPTALVVNPIKFFVGAIEIVGEVAKVASLSFRLFGNIFAGEVLLAAMAAIFVYALPIPFLFLEVGIGVLQALIFALLSLVYFTIAAQDEAH